MASLLAACGGSVSNDSGVADAARSDTASPSSSDASPTFDASPATDAIAQPDTTPPATDVSVPPSCGCIAEPLGWGLDGGFVPARDRSSVAACQTYSHTRPQYNGPTLECTQELLPCYVNSLGIGDVTAALANPDVVDAFRNAPILYGVDTRGGDGQVFVVTYGGKTITVGMACSTTTSPPCRPIPAGVAALEQLLRSLDGQELARGTCGQVFHGK